MKLLCFMIFSFLIIQNTISVAVDDNENDDEDQNGLSSGNGDLLINGVKNKNDKTNILTSLPQQKQNNNKNLDLDTADSTIISSKNNNNKQQQQQQQTQQQAQPPSLQQQEQQQQVDENDDIIEDEENIDDDQTDDDDDEEIENITTTSVSVTQINSNKNPIKTNPASMESLKSKFFTIISKPGILAGIIGGIVIALLTAILLIMFIIYRIRKKDEGSYALEDTKKPLSSYEYRNVPTKEFYA